MRGLRRWRRCRWESAVGLVVRPRRGAAPLTTSVACSQHRPHTLPRGTVSVHWSCSTCAGATLNSTNDEGVRIHVHRTYRQITTPSPPPFPSPVLPSSTKTHPSSHCFWHTVKLRFSFSPHRTVAAQRRGALRLARGKIIAHEPTPARHGQHRQQQRRRGIQ